MDLAINERFIKEIKSHTYISYQDEDWDVDFCPFCGKKITIVSNSIEIQIPDEKYDRLEIAQSYLEDATEQRIEGVLKQAMFSLEIAVREVIVYLEEVRSSTPKANQDE